MSALNGALTEFVLMLVLAGLLLFACAVLASGIEKTEKGWKIPKAPLGFTFGLSGFAAALIGFAFWSHLKPSGAQPLPIEIDRVYLNWSGASSNSNDTAVITMPPIKVGDAPGHEAWQWLAETSITNPVLKAPTMFATIVAVDSKGIFVNHRHRVQVAPIAGKPYKYGIEVTVHDLPQSADIKNFEIQLDCIAVQQKP
jgi:hypothetical protein